MRVTTWSRTGVAHALFRDRIVYYFRHFRLIIGKTNDPLTIVRLKFTLPLHAKSSETMDLLQDEQSNTILIVPMCKYQNFSSTSAIYGFFSTVIIRNRFQTHSFIYGVVRDVIVTYTKFKSSTGPEDQGQAHSVSTPCHRCPAELPISYNFFLSAYGYSAISFFEYTYTLLIRYWF